MDYANYLRDIWTLYRATRWLLPMVEKWQERFSIVSNLYLGLEVFPIRTLQIAWELTLTKWYLLYTKYINYKDGASDTCGLCMYFGGCRPCVIGFQCGETPFYAYVEVRSKRNALAMLAWLIRKYESTRGLDEIKDKGACPLRHAPCYR